MAGRVCGRSVTGTSNVILTSNMSENETANIDEGSSDSLSSNLIDHRIDHSDDLSSGRVWTKRNGHGGKELGEKSTSRPNAGSSSVSEQAGEVWIRELSKRQLQDGQVVDGVLWGEWRDDGGRFA